MFLAYTVENILANIRGNTEIIVILDGQWADPGVPDAPNVTVIYHNQSIGQRGAQNEGARLSQSKYVMKIDAHCVVDEGFDVKMMDAMKGHDNWTMVPMLYNLHAFDWKCPDNHRIYQGPTPKKCLQCGKPMVRELKMEPRWSRKSTFYRFDKTLHFQYWGDFNNRPEGKPDIAPTLSLQGSCFMLTRERYWALEIADENHGSWGQQGVEVALKTWLSGGEVMVNKKTWYSHMFRTQGGDFGFPFPLSGSDVDKARKYSRDLFIEDKWENPNKIHDLNWLLEKFRPVPDWHYKVPENKTKASKGVVYYTHKEGNEQMQPILDAVRKQIKKGIKEKHIVSLSNKPINFGKNFVMQDPIGWVDLATKVLKGVQESKAEVLFFCEHDVLYHPSHFNFVPPRRDVIYYNTNVWRVRKEDGFALFCNDLRQLSGLCAYRDVLLKHFTKRLELIKKYIEVHGDGEDFNRYMRAMGFEPGTHNRQERVDDLTSDVYQSQYPNFDIRHDQTSTPSRWRKDQFRNEKYTQGWTEAWSVPGWGETKNRVDEILASI